MGGLILDGKGKQFAVLEAALKDVIHIGKVNFFFHLQLVMIREVEGDCHVGLPHTALHVVHGKGVGAGGNGFFCAFVIELYWRCWIAYT